jgi:TetR/AcrR family transcriptional repressor of nem operon
LSPACACSWHSCNDLGIQALLAATDTPAASFYHHFRDKENFALQAIDASMAQVHLGLDVCLHDQSHPPLARVRHVFELTEQTCREESYMGCLLGQLGQDLSGAQRLIPDQDRVLLCRNR